MLIAKCTRTLQMSTPQEMQMIPFSAVKCSTRLSLIRSVILAAHWEGERNATNRREWPLATVILRTHLTKNHNDLYVSFLHPCRLYYRPSCRLWWPVAVLSTLLESSKTWMLPQSWKTSRLSFGTAPSSLDDVVVFVPSHRGDMLRSSFAITVTWPWGKSFKDKDVFIKLSWGVFFILKQSLYCIQGPVCKIY